MILNRQALTRLRQTKRVLLVKGFDELNVIRSMEELYDGLDKDNRSAFRDLYCWVYIEVLLLCRRRPDHDDIVDELVELYLSGLLPYNREEIRKMSEDRLLEQAEKISFPPSSKLGQKADEYLKELLSTPNEITQVAYDAEVYRKRDRAEEAVNAARGDRGKQIEMDHQLRYWSRATGWYSDIITEDANEIALEDCGIDMVRWVTQKDDRVCNSCAMLDGRTFEIHRIPDHPHRGCRCYVVPVDF